MNSDAFLTCTLFSLPDENDPEASAYGRWLQCEDAPSQSLSGLIGFHLCLTIFQDQSNSQGLEGGQKACQIRRNMLATQIHW